MIRSQTPARHQPTKLSYGAIDFRAVRRSTTSGVLVAKRPFDHLCFKRAREFRQPAPDRQRCGIAEKRRTGLFLGLRSARQPLGGCTGMVTRALLLWKCG